MGLRIIGDVAAFDLEMLERRLGEHGRHLFELARGIDPREVRTSDDVKSVSHEHTFDEDTADPEELETTLLFLSEKVSRRLRKYDLKGRTLTLKIRLKGFKTYTRACTLPARTNFVDVIYKNSLKLFEEFLKTRQYIRLIGVRISNFEDAYVQESLFSTEADTKRENVHRAVDWIKDKFGEGSIRRGI